MVTFLPLQCDNLDVFFEGVIILDNITGEFGYPFSMTINENQINSCWRPGSRLIFPHKKINLCLTNINLCLTDINRHSTNTENQFYKVLVISFKYHLSISMYWLYQLNISLLRFLH